MARIFDGPDAPRRFRILGASHLLSVTVFVLLNALIVVFRARIRDTALDMILSVELAYCWAMGGALQGLLTPDVEGSGFPNFRFLTTIISRGLIVTANLY